MSEPSDELMMEILRQIHATQGDHTPRFDDQAGRFQRVEKPLDELHESMITALGFAGHANVRHDTVSEKLDDLTRRVEALEEKR